MEEKKEVKVEGRSKKSKVITVFLGIALFGVFSLLLLAILDDGSFLRTKCDVPSGVKECNCEKEDNEPVECNCPNNGTCTAQVLIPDHIVNTRIGTIHIVNNGEVYLEPTGELDPAMCFTADCETYNIKSALEKTFGKATKINLKSDENYVEGKKEFDGYKLPLSNIKSVDEFFFGNGSDDDYIIFLSTSGKINELFISSTGKGVILTQNVKGYDNIVSMEASGSESGWTAIAYDNCNVGHSYSGANK